MKRTLFSAVVMLGAVAVSPLASALQTGLTTSELTYITVSPEDFLKDLELTDANAYFEKNEAPLVPVE